MGALDLPPKKWTGLGGQTLSESWADVAQRRMQAAGIVEALDIQEEVSAGLGAGTINPMVNPLGLQAMKEALCWCVVQTIAFAAHRRCNGRSREGQPIRLGGILNAANRSGGSVVTNPPQRQLSLMPAVADRNQNVNN